MKKPLPIVDCHIRKHKLDQIHKLADEVNYLMDNIDEVEASLETWKKRKLEIETELLPDLLAETGMGDFSRGDSDFKMGFFVSGSFPKGAAGKKAAQWLMDHGLGDIIKAEVSVRFPRGEIDKAKRVMTVMKPLCEPTLKGTVHPQTFHAMVRRRMKEGKPLDLNLLGVYAARKVNVKRKKEEADGNGL